VQKHGLGLEQAGLRAIAVPDAGALCRSLDAEIPDWQDRCRQRDAPDHVPGAEAELDVLARKVRFSRPVANEALHSRSLRNKRGRARGKQSTNRSEDRFVAEDRS
jgi:hypothetical protein